MKEGLRIMHILPHKVPATTTLVSHLSWFRFHSFLHSSLTITHSILQTLQLLQIARYDSRGVYRATVHYLPSVESILIPGPDWGRPGSIGGYAFSAYVEHALHAPHDISFQLYLERPALRSHVIGTYQE